MTRSRLRNKYLKNRNNINKLAFNKQRNLCTKLQRSKKKEYFANIDTLELTDNKSFWKTVKPLFSDKSSNSPKITLIEQNEIISEELETAKILNNYFNKIVENLNIESEVTLLQNKDQIDDPVLSAINKYEKHPSILRIKNNMKDKNQFSFTYINSEDFESEIFKLDPSKSVKENDIPIKITKNNSDIIARYLSKDFNRSIDRGIYPSGLKYSDITPVFKSGERSNKSNYRPVSILPSLSKLCERIIFAQMYEYMNTILSKYQCGFRKGISTQHSLIAMIEQWRKTLDDGGACGALLTDLSKAFDCMKHDLLIAKLHAYGFSAQSLKLINSCLSGRKHRTKI